MKKTLLHHRRHEQGQLLPTCASKPALLAAVVPLAFSDDPEAVPGILEAYERPAVDENVEHEDDEELHDLVEELLVHEQVNPVDLAFRAELTAAAKKRLSKKWAQEYQARKKSHPRESPEAACPACEESLGEEDEGQALETQAEEEARARGTSSLSLWCRRCR